MYHIVLPKYVCAFQVRIQDKYSADFLNERRRRKILEGSGVQALRRNFFGFLLLKSPFLGFRVIRTRYWPDFNVDSVFIIKNVLL